MAETTTEPCPKCGGPPGCAYCLHYGYIKRTKVFFTSFPRFADDQIEVMVKMMPPCHPESIERTSFGWEAHQCDVCDEWYDTMPNRPPGGHQDYVFPLAPAQAR